MYVAASVSPKNKEDWAAVESTPLGKKTGVGAEKGKKKKARGRFNLSLHFLYWLLIQKRAVKIYHFPFLLHPSERIH